MAKFKVGDVVVRNDRKDDVREILFVGSYSYFYRYVDNPSDECCVYIDFIDKNFTIKPKKITITKEDLAKAWQKSLPIIFKAKACAYFQRFCKELGLE